MSKEVEIPKFKVGDTVYFVNDYYIKKLEIGRVVDEGEGWIYEPNEFKFSSETTYEPFATKAEAEKYRLELIDEVTAKYKKDLIDRKRS